MLISFVVRLAPSALSAGVLAGEVEHVSSGERGQFRDAVELTSWCARSLGALPRQVAPPEPRQTATAAPPSPPTPGS